MGRFFIPVLALFYIASQVSLEQFSIIMSVFALTTLLLDVPTGVIADLIGKKNTLLLSGFMYIIEIFLIAFFNGFWIFLIAKIISGIGVSLGSGTDSALLFDTLKKQKRIDQHKKISGSISTVSNISMAFVFIIGAFLFSINPKLPAILSLPLVTLGFFLTFFLEEPYKSRKKFNVKNYFKHLKEGFVYFKNSKYIQYLCFLALFVSATISITLSMSSAYFKEILIPVSVIGILAFVASLTTAFASKKTHSLEKFLGEHKSFLLIQMGIVVGLFLISLMIPFFGFLFYLIIAFIAGFSGVLLGDYINHHIETSHRATILSIKGMFSNIGVFILFILVGKLTSFKGLGFSFLIFASVILIGFVLIFFYFRKHNLVFSQESATNQPQN